MSTAAAVPALASCLLSFSAPALAHARHHMGVHYRHLLRRAAMPGAANGFAFGMDGGATAAPWGPQRQHDWNAWNDSNWGSPPRSGALDGMTASTASEAGVPLSLVQRVIRRESGGNPRAASRGNYGLMQIKLGTAHAMGYSGSASGLLDPQTNLTYAVRYLAGAYQAAGGNENRAVALYARGYHAQPRAQDVSPYARETEFGGFRQVAYAPRGFAPDRETAAAMAGPFYDYAAPVRRLRYHRHWAG